MWNIVVWKNILLGVVVVIVTTVVVNYLQPNGCMTSSDGRSVSIVHMGASK
jgi:hypothetical protein